MEQIKATIESMSASERKKIVRWFDEHRHELIGDAGAADGDLSEAQEAELLRRRREYDEHPERFVSMDKKSLDRMFARVRKNVAAQIPSAR